MKVRLKKLTRHSKYRTDFTSGNIYFVIGIEAGDYRIMNDLGQPYLYPSRLFEVVDPTPGANWRQTMGTEGEIYAYPPGLDQPGFFEDYFAGNRRTHAILERYLISTRKIAKRPPGKAA